MSRSKRPEVVSGSEPSPVFLVERAIDRAAPSVPRPRVETDPKRGTRVDGKWIPNTHEYYAPGTVVTFSARNTMPKIDLYKTRVTPDYLWLRGFGGGPREAEETGLKWSPLSQTFTVAVKHAERAVDRHGRTWIKYEISDAVVRGMSRPYWYGVNGKPHPDGEYMFEVLEENVLEVSWIQPDENGKVDLRSGLRRAYDRVLDRLLKPAPHRSLREVTRPEVPAPAVEVDKKKGLEVAGKWVPYEQERYAPGTHVTFAFHNTTPKIDLYKTAVDAEYLYGKGFGGGPREAEQTGLKWDPLRRRITLAVKSAERCTDEKGRVWMKFEMSDAIVKGLARPYYFGQWNREFPDGEYMWEVQEKDILSVGFTPPDAQGRVDLRSPLRRAYDAAADGLRRALPKRPQKSVVAPNVPAPKTAADSAKGVTFEGRFIPDEHVYYAPGTHVTFSLANATPKIDIFKTKGDPWFMHRMGFGGGSREAQMTGLKWHSLTGRFTVAVKNAHRTTDADGRTWMRFDYAEVLKRGMGRPYWEGVNGKPHPDGDYQVEVLEKDIVRIGFTAPDAEGRIDLRSPLRKAWHALADRVRAPRNLPIPGRSLPVPEEASATAAANGSSAAAAG